MKNNNNNEARFSIEELAMDLLDFCGGDHPRHIDVTEWMKRRGFKFNTNQIQEVTTMAEMFLQETPLDFQFN